MRTRKPTSRYKEYLETRHSIQKKPRSKPYKIPQRLKEIKWAPYPALRHYQLETNKWLTLGKLESRFRLDEVRITRASGNSDYGAELRFLNKLEKETGHSFELSSKMSDAKKKVEARFSISFEAWRRGREAQHLIPASLGIKLNIPEIIINSKENFIMLRGGNRPPRQYKHKMEMSEDQGLPELSKSYFQHKTSYENNPFDGNNVPKSRMQNLLDKAKHIKEGMFHDKYDEHVLNVIDYMDKRAKEKNEELDYYHVMDVLRNQHKSGDFEFVDDMLSLKDSPDQWSESMEFSIERTETVRRTKGQKDLMKQHRAANRLKEQIRENRRLKDEHDREMQEMRHTQETEEMEEMEEMAVEAAG